LGDSSAIFSVTRTPNFEAVASVVVYDLADNFCSVEIEFRGPTPAPTPAPVPLTFSPSAVGEIEKDTAGNEFYLSFLRNFDHDLDEANAVELYLSSPTLAVVNVEFPVGSFYASRTLVAGETTVLTLPTNSSLGWVPGFFVQSNSIRVYAEQPQLEFDVYMVNYANLTTDASLALPVDALGSKYVIIDSANSVDLVTVAPPEFVVTAVYDNTLVTITPSEALVTTGLDTFTVTLNRGQSYYGSPQATFGRVDDVTLSGTIIDATMPVAVTNGVLCGEVPTGVIYCDHVFEMAVPVEAWSTFYLAAALPLRPLGSVYRLVAYEAGTGFSISTTDGESQSGTLNRGEHWDSGELTGDIIIVADKPVFAVQLMTGIDRASTGDPSMVNLVSPEQFVYHHTFATVTNITETYVSIICSNEDVGNMTLDGSVIPAWQFSAITTTGYSSAVLPISSGTHMTESVSAGHGITVAGYRNYESYLYSGGFKYFGDSLFQPRIGRGKKWLDSHNW